MVSAFQGKLMTFWNTTNAPQNLQDSSRKSLLKIAGYTGDIGITPPHNRDALDFSEISIWNARNLRMFCCDYCGNHTIIIVATLVYTLLSPPSVSQGTTRRSSHMKLNWWPPQNPDTKPTMEGPPQIQCSHCSIRFSETWATAQIPQIEVRLTLPNGF